MDRISMLELIACVSEVVDLISDEIKDHHIRVAWGAYHLTEAMGIPGAERRNIVIAAAMHDVGGLSLNARLEAVEADYEDSNSHAEKGYRLLSPYVPFQSIANMIRNHHTPWDYGRATDASDNPIPMGSQIILLADRISVMLRPDATLLAQTDAVSKVLLAQENSIYAPQIIAAFRTLLDRSYFWLDMMTRDFPDLKDKLRDDDVFLSGPDLTGALEMLSRIIDYRSTFTAVHSRGVAVVADELSRLLAFPDSERQLIRAAGLLHDIGKLAVPSEVIEKNGPLDDSESRLIHSHTYYTEKVLSNLSGGDVIRRWASFHHENLDGSGYPFGLREEELDTGARILKVADVFSALMEDRPYRKSVGPGPSAHIMREMTETHELDPQIVAVLRDNLDVISEKWRAEARTVADEYAQFSS